MLKETIDAPLATFFNNRYRFIDEIGAGGMGTVYRVTDRLSVGGGPLMMYGYLEMKLKAPPPAGNGKVTLVLDRS